MASDTEREPLTRDRVVVVALRLLDEDGLEKLTLRRIAKELDVQAPALYWHVANKRALLDYLTDAMVAGGLAGLRGRKADEQWWQWLHRAAALLRAVACSNIRTARGWPPAPT
ncbi:TetR family transcriptional regulator [Fodinicola feengrottensis]|uniref:TetR family transcriptional regulator n=1 Tax=Fodinicola feengrottensis TaxID=435914 RepID=UPI0013D87780|nr:TetR family transcriptional regulator [Fodinicola feengrottensis]